jgi:hypothetical protein
VFVVHETLVVACGRHHHCGNANSSCSSSSVQAPTDDAGSSVSAVWPADSPSGRGRLPTPAAPQIRGAHSGVFALRTLLVPCMAPQITACQAASVSLRAFQHGVIDHRMSCNGACRWCVLRSTPLTGRPGRAKCHTSWSPAPRCVMQQQVRLQLARPGTLTHQNNTYHDTSQLASCHRAPCSGTPTRPCCCTCAAVNHTQSCPAVTHVYSYPGRACCMLTRDPWTDGIPSTTTN